MDLTSANSYGQLVNVASSEVPSLKRVKPSDAANSFLFQKINCLLPDSGTRMPKGSGTVTLAEQALIRDWINQGALSGSPNVTVSSVAPVSGPTAGGTAVTIKGTNFATGATVTFGGAAATNVSVADSTTITATTPAHAAGGVDVVVTSGGKSATLAGGFTYTSPSISSVSPAVGPIGGGTAVTISGANFTPGAAVTFGGTAATNVTVASATSISATTPAHAAGAVDIVVRNSDGAAATLAGGFTYLGPPSVTAVSPASGSAAGGTAVTISGSNFFSGAGVTIGGAAAGNVSVANATTINATTPAHAAGAADVVVTNPDGQSASLAGAFTFIQPPVISSVSPSSGPTAGGTALTISGSGFKSGATVAIGDAQPVNVSIVDAGTIRVTTVAHAAATLSVTVSNPDGISGTLNNAFSYNDPPVVTSPLSFSADAQFAGGEITFAVAATDPQGLPLNAVFDYGDGTSDSSGKHVYAAAGTFTVTATLSNGITSSKSSAQVTVAAKLPMTVTKLQGKAKFTMTLKDSCSFSGILPQQPALFNPKGKSITFNAGGAAATFALDAKGRGKSEAGVCKLKIKFVRNKATGALEFPGGDVPVQAKFKGTFADAWRNEGVDPSATVSKLAIQMIADVKLDGKVYSQTVSPLLTGRALKGARFDFKL